MSGAAALAKSPELAAAITETIVTGYALELLSTPLAGTEEPLLRNISFRVPARKLGLMYGRSGAGKTTLLQLVAGLSTPHSWHHLHHRDIRCGWQPEERACRDSAVLVLTAMHP